MQLRAAVRLLLATAPAMTLSREHRANLRLPRDENAKGSRPHSPRKAQSDNYDHPVPEGKIVGGIKAGRDDFPFFVETPCGGSLIAKDLVLSAAHCAGGTRDQVLVNAFEFSTQDSKSEWVDTDGEYLHDQWDESTYDYDIMLIKLKRPVTNPAIQVVPLAGENYPFSSGQTLTVTGFGDTTGNRDYSDELLKVDVNYVDHSTCDSSESYDGRITEDVMFCAGIYPNGGKDSCVGDSGGPIMDSNGVQVGVVSWGEGCGVQFLPGVYASVPKAMPWIRQKACELSPEHAGSWACDNSNTPQPSPSPSPAPAPPTPSPTPSPVASPVDYYLEVQYDYWSWETRAFVRDTTAGVNVVNFPFDNNRDNNALVSQKINLVPGKWYQLRVEDSYGDGIHDGYAAVYATGNGVSEELAYIDGNDFAWDDQVTFTVAEDIGRASTSKAGCLDTHKKFKVNDAVGIQGCDWLDAQKPRFDYLCDFTDVAMACPKLCNACHWLQ